MSIDPSLRQSTRGGAPNSLIAIAIYGHIGKALFHTRTDDGGGGASWSVGGTMPPARPPLASQPVFRLNATLVFKQTEYRGAQRIYAQLVDSRQRKWDKVWLSLDDPLARLEAIMSFYSLSA